MLKKLVFLAASTLAAAAFKKYWNRAPAAQATKAKRAHHRDPVHRWEDEGGMVPTVATQAKPAAQRRRSATNAATKTPA